jgi:hypothetical protein
VRVGNESEPSTLASIGRARAHEVVVRLPVREREVGEVLVAAQAQIVLPVLIVERLEADLKLALLAADNAMPSDAVLALRRT